MRKPPAITPPAAPKTAVKPVSKPTPKARPRTTAAATPALPAPAPAKRVPKAAQAVLTLELAPVPAAPKVPSVKKRLSAKADPPKAAPVRALKPSQTPTAKPVPKTAAKTIPVKAAASSPVPVRVVAETPAAYFAGAGGHAWRMSSRYAVAYVRDANLAGELLATEPRYLAKAAMAVYYDRKGKPFAWQFRFDTTRWAEVVGRLG